MDVSAYPACDNNLDMLKTTSRIDPNLNAAMVDGRRFSNADRSGGPSRVKSNFVIAPRCRSKVNSERNRDICFSTDKRGDATEPRELPRDWKAPESPPMRTPDRLEDHSPEQHSDHVEGMFRMQTLSTYQKHARRRNSSINPSRYASGGGNDVHPRKRPRESGDMDELIDDCSIKSVQYPNHLADKSSDGANILSKMYASFGHESSHTKNRYLSGSKMDSTVKIEPNFEEWHNPKRARGHFSNDRSNVTDSHTRKLSGSSSVSDSRHPLDSRTTPPTQQDSSPHRHSPPLRNRAFPQRKRLNTKTKDREFTTKRRRLSSDLPSVEIFRPRETNLPSGHTVTSRHTSWQTTSARARHVDDNSHKSDGPFPIEPKHPYIADQTAENMLHFPNYSLMHDQLNVLPPMACNGIGYHHDPNLFLKSASLGASSMNPFLLGMNACVMNPFLMSSLEHSEIMAAAAYRQAIAAQILKSRIAGVKPLLGLGLMDPASSVYGGLSNIMYGLPESAHFANSIGSAFRRNASDLPMNAHQPHEVKKNAGLGKDIQNKSDNRNQESPNSYHSDNIRRSSILDQEKEHVKSSRCESPRVLPSIKDTFRRLSQPMIPDNSLNAIDSDDYDCSRVDQHKNSLSRTKVQSVDFGKKKTNNRHDPAAKNSVKMPLEFTHAVPVKSSDMSEEDNTSPADGKTFSRASSYKNLTKERRLVANARERTRVHTISSAFEELRRQIPSYSCNQKLSKLAILRIACSYIQSLSVLAGRSTEGTFKESVDQCTGVLQAESKARCRRKNTKAQVEWEMDNYEKSSTSIAINELSSSRLTSSPRTSEYWQADHIINGSRGVDSSSNDSDPPSPLNKETVYAAEHRDLEDKQDDMKPDESSSSIDETMAELSPINVDD